MSPDEERQFVEYVSSRLPRLHRVAYLLCGDATRADDVVQATVTSLYVYWHRASRAESLDAYTHRILMRRHADEQRRPWSRVVLTRQLPDWAAAPSQTAEDADVVHAALARLPAGQRAVIVLRYLADLSVEQTANVLGCTQGNVKSQTSRGLATLRELLQYSAEYR
jgi:RNA polymerase sigma-70 factor (sigma-E family)